MVGCTVMGQMPQPGGHCSAMECSPAQELNFSEMWYQQLSQPVKELTPPRRPMVCTKTCVCKERDSRLLSLTLGCRDPCLNNESRAPLPKAVSKLMAASCFCVCRSPRWQSQLDGAASRSVNG